MYRIGGTKYLPKYRMIGCVMVDSGWIKDKIGNQCGGKVVVQSFICIYSAKYKMKSLEIS